MNNYIKLIKPRIIFVNLIAVLGGFYFSKFEKCNFSLLFFTLLGTFFIISSGCIFNNIIDIDIDKKMYRTKKRLLIISNHLIFYSKFFGCLFFVLSIFIFLNKVNLLSCLLSIIGFFFYVIIYSYYLKRTSIYDIFFGSISGAIPPLIGYCAISNYIDLKCILLFLLFIFWQIAHSYSILIINNTDYQIANIPTIVIKKGKLITIKNIIFYIFLFIIIIILFYIFHYINIIYFLILLFFSFIWLFISYIYFLLLNYYNFSRLLFYWSIIIMIIFNIILIINH
ncbi:heme o synthase [Buchnera aphidicola]|nr:heme o synthase [Buchnera aphidicola]